MENPIIRRGLDKLNSSLNHMGDTFEKAFEEGRTIVENKTQHIIQMRRKEAPAFTTNLEATLDLQNQTNNQTQLKVAMATAANAKLLLRELKMVKADLAFSKERCDQLEEENKILRESREKEDNPEDDDLIRVQLESLLAEKARLAKENSIYARENRLLREIVEYHQLSMHEEAKDVSNSEETDPNIPQPSPHNARETQDATTLTPHSSLQT